MIYINNILNIYSYYRIMKITPKKEGGVNMATKKNESPEFLYLPLESIIVEEQVRSGIDINTESFKALMESIKDRGILEPVLVTPKDDKYLLLCGERRFLAARELGLISIPARVVNAIIQRDEILALQLIENLQREDLNPIDQAKGILAFIQARHPEKGYDADGVLNEMMSYNRRPDSVSEIIAATVAAIIEISGKSSKTLYNLISLLKTPPEIQSAIQAGNLPVSQGYIFAANPDCPDLSQIFNNIIKTPVTNKTLERMLTAYKKVKPIQDNKKPVPLKKQIDTFRSFTKDFEAGLSSYTKPDLVMLLDDLHVFCALVELRVQVAPIPAPAKEEPGKKRPQI